MVPIGWYLLALVGVDVVAFVELALLARDSVLGSKGCMRFKGHLTLEALVVWRDKKGVPSECTIVRAVGIAYRLKAQELVVRWGGQQSRAQCIYKNTHGTYKRSI